MIDRDVQYEDRSEERRQAKEERSIERAQINREEPFLCQKLESGGTKCKNQCDVCLESQIKLLK